MLKVITVQDLLLVGHRMWYLMDIFTIPSAGTTPTGAKANADVQDLLVTLRNLCNRVHYIVHDSRFATDSHGLQTAVQEHLREFFEEWWDIVGEMMLAVDAVIDLVIAD